MHNSHNHCVGTLLLPERATKKQLNPIYLLTFTFLSYFVILHCYSWTDVTESFCLSRRVCLRSVKFYFIHWWVVFQTLLLRITYLDYIASKAPVLIKLTSKCRLSSCFLEMFKIPYKVEIPQNRTTGIMLFILVLSCNLNIPCPLFTSSWPQRRAFHLTRPSDWDVDGDYSCNHLVFWSSSTVNPSVQFVSNFENIVSVATPADV